MRAQAKIDARQIDEMKLDITFRMKVSEWRDLMRQQPSAGWPASYLGRQISSVLGHITKSTEVTFTEPRHEAEAGDEGIS